MRNSDIARQFNEIADILELKGRNRFRVRAYRRAARSVEAESKPVAQLYDDDPRALEKIPGVGSGIRDKLKEIIETGKLQQEARVTGTGKCRPEKGATIERRLKRA